MTSQSSQTVDTGESLEWTSAREPDDHLAPPAVYADIQRSADPIRRIKIWDGSEPWLITKYDHYRQIAGDAASFSSDRDKPGFPLKNAGYQSKGKGLTGLDDPEHQPYRRIWAKNVTAKKMEELRPEMQQVVDECIDKMLAGPKPADLIADFALPVPALILGAAFGIPAEDRQTFLDLASVMSSSTSTKEDTARAMAQLREYGEQLVSERESNPQDDIISRFVKEGLESGVLDHERLVNQVVTLTTAAHDTSTGMIAMAALALFHAPDQMKLLQDNSDDPKFVANATEELLRFIAPTQTGRRRVATKDIEIGGHLIKAGEGVIALDSQSSRDPDVFDNPDVLDLQRVEARRHNAFGFGIHQCAGQSLARVELQVVYSTLFKRIPTLRLAVPEEELPFREDTIVYILDSMPVTW